LLFSSAGQASIRPNQTRGMKCPVLVIGEQRDYTLQGVLSLISRGSSDREHKLFLIA